jgi:hypothetical protein
MARVTQRDHEVKRRSRCSSSPARPFPTWNVSFTRHLDPAMRTSVARSAAVGEKWCGRGASQLMAAGPRFGQFDDGPVVEAVALGASPG